MVLPGAGGLMCVCDEDISILHVLPRRYSEIKFKSTDVRLIPFSKTYIHIIYGYILKIWQLKRQAENTSYINSSKGEAQPLENWPHFAEANIRPVFCRRQVNIILRTVKADEAVDHCALTKGVCRLVDRASSQQLLSVNRCVHSQQGRNRHAANAGELVVSLNERQQRRIVSCGGTTT